MRQPPSHPEIAEGAVASTAPSFLLFHDVDGIGVEPAAETKRLASDGV
jgi:hypothetical protein